MNYRATLAAATLAVACGTALAQTPATAKAAPAKQYAPPKLPWGDPDLQGQWPATANIPMQRAATFGTRAFLTDEEFTQRQKQAARQSESDSEEFAPSTDTGHANVTINPPGYWQ